jgi:Domain of unknown function (DUF4296)
MKILPFILTTLLLAACGGPPGSPSDVLSETQMQKVLVDIHLIEARISKMNIPSMDTATLVTEKLKADVFKKHQTDSATYNRSYRFYATYPDYFENIYSGVIKDLETKKK